MPAQGQRRLVIDANVARSSGETEHPASRKCREFLDATTEFGHRVVMTAEIQQEWRTHASRYASRWLTRMYARRRVYRSAVGRDDQLRRRVALVLPSSPDLHLVEAANATDRLVASQDERARSALRRAAGRIGELQRIVWVNPVHHSETPIDWLRRGAKSEVGRQLGT